MTPTSENGTVNRNILLRAAMMAFAGVDDILNAAQCETYSGVFNGQEFENLSDDDKTLLNRS